MRQDHVPA